MSDSTTRFSDRVADYIATRPEYPLAILDILREHAGLTSSLSTSIADVGSGTGLSSEMFLKNGNLVFGVEPNREMRMAAEDLLAGWPNFCSVAGSAEATTLPDASVDLIVVGQAFHWFDPPRARVEFRRILRPGGQVVLMWNTRRIDSSPFLRGYEQLLQKYGTDYREVVHTNIDQDKLAAFFGGTFQSFRLDNAQVFDREGLRGRTRSSSFTPTIGDLRFEPMMRELDQLFDSFHEDGRVRFEYDTELYVGSITLP
ncbi:MAG TPA: class I SAM-dependent methyltransferase [Gemmataceae bacterium]|jgi:SAM-dependent methyltransferase|nr:class I SAM-dependent methyltransferase [Gemmataceae bacterium]